ncbi:MAG: U32 family peptidase [Bacilli bacterium]
MNKIELLAPAGNLEKLKFAFMYGADACYIGGRNYSLRANATNFSLEEIKEACTYAHSINKKVYVTVNIVFHDEDTEGITEYLKKLSEYKVDAIIVSDPFIIDIINNNKINLKIHISTQASTLNYETVMFWKSLGVERVVLARELSKNEIKEIIDKTGVEVETFVHGAMCSSYSGRCVLSNYFTNRDANRGGCAQICRWEFSLYDSKMNKIESDTMFTASSKDLMMASNIKEIIEVGITSLKVEGRMRSNYYVATVINTYRNIIDDYYNNKLTDDRLNHYIKILNRVANREATVQFWDKLPTVEEQYYLGRNEVSNQDFLGVVLDYDEETKIVTITERNYFKTGDVVEVFGPNIDTFTFTMPDIYDEDNNKVNIGRHPEEILRFKLDKKVYKNDIIRVKID